ncbi:MAG TPA: dihydrodipicolinate synthase family protein [Naasia sp.]|jgi:4-hydroxy-tetrahydrodipicolinate synthase
MTEPVRRDILTAVPVAFAEDGALDLDGSRAILRKVAASDVQGALVLGTTGEFPALSEDERGELTRASLEELAGKRVVVHVGAASAYEVKRLIDRSRRLGATEIAVLTPYYLAVSDAAVLEFFEDVVAHAEGLRVYAYVFQARTGVPVSAELLARIAELRGVVGAKISGESLEQVARYRAAVPADFELWTGSDRDLALAADFGAQGVISGIASVFPEPFTELTAALAAGDEDAAREAETRVHAAVDLILGDMGRMKAALQLQGIPAGTTRMPIEPPTAAVLDEIRVMTESLYASR